MLDGIVCCTGLSKRPIPRLCELAPAARGVQEVGSRNLGIDILPNPVFDQWKLCVLRRSVNVRFSPF